MQKMKIIPVLDLYKGFVVHAVKGDRKNYKPIDSRLCNSSDPLQIIKGLLANYNFKCVYIADLDALESQGNNIKTIESIIYSYPKLEIWLDTGDKLIQYYLDTHSTDQVRIILSTESIRSLSSYKHYLDSNPNHKFILSIDYISGKILGPDELIQSQSYWPSDVLVLNLDRVGSNKGIQIPEIINSNTLMKRFNIFYGGGVKNLSDLNDLKSIGVTGALVSTALHKEKILKEDLQQIT